MKLDFWKERWKNNEIGFHQADINPYLLKYWEATGASMQSGVLVPLCGKSKDLTWLAEQNYQVIGVEISQLAVEAFFEENGLRPKQSTADDFILYETDAIKIYCGDFFKLDRKHIEACNSVYDRAAIVALPEDIRARYVQKLTKLLSRESVILLVTMEYPQEEMNGPPFSVTKDEVHKLYADNYEITPIDSYDVLANNEVFRERGLTRLSEHTYILRKY